MFISEDPIGWASGQTNNYAYVGGNPVQGSDPSGLQMVLSPSIFAIGGLPPNALQRAIANALANSSNDDPTKTYQDYTRYNPSTGGCYSGRTSGYGTPQQNILARAAGQPLLNAEHFNPPILDRSSDSYIAIRGREQQLIDLNGGARSSGGTSRNMINGISPNNPTRGIMLGNALAEFGEPTRGRNAQARNG